MKRNLILVMLIGLTFLSCQKKEQSGTLPHQTVSFAVGPDFEINMPGALPDVIKMVTLKGNFQPIDSQDEVALLLHHKGSEYADTLVVKSGFSMDNFDTDYFKFINGQNVLKGKILIRSSKTWRECYADELSFKGQLSFVYNPE